MSFRPYLFLRLFFIATLLISGKGVAKELSCKVAERKTPDPDRPKFGVSNMGGAVTDIQLIPNGNDLYTVKVSIRSGPDNYLHFTVKDQRCLFTKHDPNVFLCMDETAYEVYSKPELKKTYKVKGNFRAPMIEMKRIDTKENGVSVELDQTPTGDIGKKESMHKNFYGVTVGLFDIADDNRKVIFEFYTPVYFNGSFALSDCTGK